MPTSLVESHCVTGSAECASNIASAVARNLPACDRRPGKPGRIAIVGSAPTASDYLDEIRSADEIWAINGAYDWLLSVGVVPHGFVGMDPQSALVDYVTRAQASSTFYLSSVCNPAVFDALAGHDIQVWHSKMEAMPYPPDALVIGGGITTITRAPYLANMLGWRDMHLFGCDSSYRSATDRYCYQSGTYKTDTSAKVMIVEVGDRAFETELGMVQQATNLCVLHDIFNGQVKFRCGGLLKALVESPICDPVDILGEAA